jgi:hypothetical protein
MTEVATTTETEETVTTTAEVTADAPVQQGEENAEKVNDVNTETDIEEEIDLYGGYKPMATATATDTVEPEKAAEAIHALREENKALLGKIESLTSEIDRLSQMYDHPVVQAAKTLVEQDGDANISAFMDIAATSNPRKMSPERIYESQMSEFLIKKGFKGDELKHKLEDALDRFSDKDELEQEITIQAYREKLIHDFDSKTQEYLGVNDEKRQEQAHIAKAYQNNFLMLKSEIDRLAEQGKFGVFTADSAWKQSALQKIQSVFRFDKNLNVDVAHAIKVINYAINPEAVEKELIKVGKTRVTTEKIAHHATKPEKDLIADEKKNASALKGTFDAMDEIIRQRNAQKK